MADPRFYDNRGPFRLAELCAQAGVDLPKGADATALVADVAGLLQAGRQHLSFYETPRVKAEFLSTKAGWCLVSTKFPLREVPATTALIPCSGVGRAFAKIARIFYPDHEMDVRTQEKAIHPMARIGTDVVLAPGVVIAAGAEIGDRTRVGPNAVIGRGVTIGRDCSIGANVSIGFAHIGDEVIVQAGGAIGGSGFGFSSAADGHVKTPQLGRVILQDRVEIGANSTVDRGALGDTVIGEGSKIDNLVQIGHNTLLGRHCILAGQVGISGSVAVGDFVLMGGKVGIADHVTIGDHVRLAALTGVGFNLAGGQDYGGVPARPIKEWQRAMRDILRPASAKPAVDE
ncbi:MAG TPA: UDP-3-O-(3-hydroxymyristoyl)glucosamine N-acyltransferase [Micropepsaceae bacterium]|nr:UDP-3-O-(3-hydroxymyristoyl)glucosamine N-acyltransferase [Micropepsaceae bacterium]